MKSGLKQRSKIRQYFCKHDRMDWYEEKGVFEGRSGKYSYYACKKCGKVNSIYFDEE